MGFLRRALFADWYMTGKRRCVGTNRKDGISIAGRVGRAGGSAAGWLALLPQCRSISEGAKPGGDQIMLTNITQMTGRPTSSRSLRALSKSGMLLMAVAVVALSAFPVIAMALPDWAYGQGKARIV
jgi:hypothetical protein